MFNGKNGKKITVIDDERELVDTIKAFLEGRGFEVSVAYGGTRGLDIIREELPDLVLLDVNMPDLDGRDVLSKLKKEEATKNIPVIILSARNDQFDEELGRELGATDYVTKPYSSHSLLKKINEVLGE